MSHRWLRVSHLAPSWLLEQSDTPKHHGCSWQAWAICAQIPTSTLTIDFVFVSDLPAKPWYRQSRPELMKVPRDTSNVVAAHTHVKRDASSTTCVSTQNSHAESLLTLHTFSPDPLLPTCIPVWVKSLSSWLGEVSAMYFWPRPSL